MKKNSILKSSSFVFASFLCLVPIEVKALPFERTPEGFLQHLNSADWNTSSEYKFINAYGCNLNDDDTSGDYATFSCFVDYEEVSPLGKRTCLNRAASYTIYPKITGAKPKTFVATEPFSTGYRIIKPGECSEWQAAADTSNNNEYNAPPKDTSYSQIPKPSDEQISTALFLLAASIAIGAIAIITVNRKDRQ